MTAHSHWSRIGYEKYDIHIKNLESNQDVDVIYECGSDIVWGNDDSTIFYTKLDDEHRDYQIWLHTIGIVSLNSEVTYH